MRFLQGCWDVFAGFHVSTNQQILIFAAVSSGSERSEFIYTLIYILLIYLYSNLFMALTEAEDIKKRWQDYTEELYKKDLHHPDNHDGVITHLEPDILECEVKWALESITTSKASRGDGIPAELFQILKDDAVKVLHSICQQI